MYLIDDPMFIILYGLMVTAPGDCVHELPHNNLSNAYIRQYLLIFTKNRLF